MKLFLSFIKVAHPSWYVKAGVDLHASHLRTSKKGPQKKNVWLRYLDVPTASMAVTLVCVSGNTPFFIRDFFIRDMSLRFAKNLRMK